MKTHSNINKMVQLRAIPSHASSQFYDFNKNDNKIQKISMIHKRRCFISITMQIQPSRKRTSNPVIHNPLMNFQDFNFATL